MDLLPLVAAGLHQVAVCGVPVIPKILAILVIEVEPIVGERTVDQRVIAVLLSQVSLLVVFISVIIL